MRTGEALLTLTIKSATNSFKLISANYCFIMFAFNMTDEQLKTLLLKEGITSSSVIVQLKQPEPIRMLAKKTSAK
jgi:hypothetical protein